MHSQKRQGADVSRTVRRLIGRPRFRPTPVLEALEDRMLLAGTPIPIDQSQSIQDGFLALSEVGPRFDSQATLLATPLDLLRMPAAQATSTTTATNLGTLIPFSALASQLNTTIQNYFTLNPSPTFEDLDARIRTDFAGRFDHLTLNIAPNLVTYAFSNLRSTAQKHLSLDLGGASQPINLSADSTASPVQVNLGLTLPDFQINIERATGRFYFNTPQVNYAVNSVELGTYSINSGFLGTTVTGGTITAPGVDNPARVNFRDPLGIGQLTAQELRNTAFQPFTNGNGSLAIATTLPLQAALGSFQTSTTAPPTVAISDANILDGRSPRYDYTNYDAILPFNRTSAQSWIDTLNKVVTALDRLADSAVFDQPIPFTSGQTVGDNLLLAGALQTVLAGVRKNIPSADGTPVPVPTFTNAQAFATQLGTILKLNVTPTFDPLTNELTFPISVTTNNPVTSVPFVLNRPDLGVTISSQAPAVSFVENGTISFTIGLRLNTGSPPKLATTSPAQGLAGPVIPLDGRLNNDATFTLTDELNRTTTITITAASTASNTSPLDLVADVNTALAAAGLGASVTAGLDTLNPQLFGTGAFPGDGRLRTDSTFALSVDGGAPIAVTVTAASTANNSLNTDFISDVNAALAKAGITRVIARVSKPVQEIDATLPVPTTGQITADATFTLKFDQGNPIPITITRAATTNNSTPSDLITDINNALQAAGQSNIIAGLRSKVIHGKPQPVIMLYAVQPGLFGTVRLGAAAGSPAITQLGFVNGQLGDNVPSLEFVGVGTPAIKLLSLNAAATDPIVAQFGFSTTQSEGFLSARLTLSTSTGDFLRFDASPTDPSLTQLGFNPGQVSRSISVTPFIRGMSYSGMLNVNSLANAASATGNYGFIGVQSTGLHISTSLPIRFAVKGAGGVPGGDLTIAELLADTATTTTTANLVAGLNTIQVIGDTAGLRVGQGLSGPGIEPNARISAISGKIVTISKVVTQTLGAASIVASEAPDLVTTPTVTGSPTARLDLKVPGLGVDSAPYNLTATVGDLNSPFSSLSLKTSGMSGFQNYQFLDFNDLSGGLRLLANDLANAGALKDTAGKPVLNSPLPIVNTSVASLTDYAAAIQNLASRVAASPASTLQSYLAQVNQLLAGLGTDASVVPTFNGLGSSTTLGLTYRFTLPNLLKGGLRLDINGVPTLVSLATGTTPGNAANLNGFNRFVDTSAQTASLLPATAQAIFNLPAGFDLSDPKNPRPFVFGSNDLASIGVNVNAPSVAEIPISLGKIGVFANKASAYLNADGKTPGSFATFTIGVGQGAGTKIYLDGNLAAASRVTVVGQAGVTLPLSAVPTGSNGPPLSPPLSIQIINLAGVLDGVAGSVAPIQAPALAGYTKLIEVIQNTPNLTSGLNKYLKSYQTQLNTQVFNRSYPIVGTQFQKVGQIFDTFRVGLAFQVGQDAYTPDPIASIQNTLFVIFGSQGLNWLADRNGNPGSLSDVIVTTDNVNFVNWSLRLLVKPAPVAQQIGMDIGLPGLQMNFPITPGLTTNTVDLNFGFDTTFNFGIDVTNGFNIDTSQDVPLKVSFDARPHIDPVTKGPAPLAGTFGFFNVDVSPDKNAPLYGNTEFKGAFTIQVPGGKTVPGKLVYKDLIDESFAIQPTLAATGNANLALTTSYPNSNFSLEILTDFEMQWNFSTADKDLSGAQPLLGFYGIGTNWADSVANFLGPSFQKVGNFLNSAPVGPILDFIGAPIPVLSYFLGPTDIVQFLGLFAGPGAGAGPLASQALLDATDLFRGLAAAIPSGGYSSEYNLVIAQGDLVIDQDVRTIKQLSDITQFSTPSDPSLDGFLDQIDVYERDPRNKNFTTDDDGGIISGKLSQSLNIGLANATISLPFFSDPKFVKSMLLGNSADLFQLVTPSASFTVQAEIDFPPIPLGPVSLVISAGGSIQPTLQFGFGFDTRGYNLSAQGKPGNIGDESFYFLVNGVPNGVGGVNTASAGTVLDIPFKLFFGAGVGIPDIFTVSVSIFFDWDNQIGLKDINAGTQYGGRVYVDQFTGIQNLQLSGDLIIGAGIDLQVFFFHKFFNLYTSPPLFSYATSTEPVLAVVDSDGVLRLNMGPDANARLSGNLSDGDESYTIRHVGGAAGNEEVEVSAFGFTQRYRGVKQIFAAGGVGNDVIEVGAGVLAPAELRGGFGHDRLIYRGAGSASLQGGDGDDDLQALGTGNVRLLSGGGNDRLRSGPGATGLELSPGNHTIIAGTGDHTLLAGGGLTYSLSDTALWIDGFRSTLQGVRNVNLLGDSRDNDFTIANWSGRATIEGHDGDDTTTVRFGGGGQVIVAPSGFTGRDRIAVIGDARGGSFLITPTMTARGRESVQYLGLMESLHFQAGSGDTTISLRGNPDGLTAIQGGTGRTTLNVLDTRRFTRTTFDGGTGESVVRIGRLAVPGAAGARGAVRGGLFLTGGSNRNTLAVGIDGDLSNLLLARGFADGSVTVKGQIAHAIVTDTGSIDTINASGSLTRTGAIRAGRLDRITLGGDLAGSVVIAGNLDRLDIGGSLKGTVEARGQLGDIHVSGDTPGSITANSVRTVTVRAASGPNLLNVTEAGVTRTITLRAPRGDLSQLRVGYVYDSNGHTPEVALRVTNPRNATFDLAISSGGSPAPFHLARLDAVGKAGVRHIAIDGDLLDRVTASQGAFFGLRPGAAGGIQLPEDTLGVVAVRGTVRVGTIQARSAQGVAFATLAQRNGRIMQGAKHAARAFARGTRLVRVGGTFGVPVDEVRSVRLFLRTRPGQKLSSPIVIQDISNDGRSNEATIVTTSVRNSTRIRSILFRRPGGVVRPRQPLG